MASNVDYLGPAKKACIILIVVGIIVLLAGILGTVGGAKENKGLLITVSYETLKLRIKFMRKICLFYDFNRYSGVDSKKKIEKKIHIQKR